MYKAKKMLGALGMKYEKIYACSNNCCLYPKKYANAVRLNVANAYTMELASDEDFALGLDEAKVGETKVVDYDGNGVPINENGHK
ncbi:uncharacterized protein E5676_scaffold828G00150 [Cucumis melo var. makuwa]|uniref:Uncharacterized protein n=1 Tax=Cucumis melo var. makuwa TaxID=1194695 RepID=A0A5A7V729_CUCMM|nr:uncharacterized protein E6C27_scaffold508G00170 [Cucumis melo var. makuwa]TYK11650.1 uncharacterized protein E5676_scaffold828G00150 [Cucumis melo var. makuwa]